MPSRSQYALMSSKDKNIVWLISFSSAVAFFAFLIYLYISDIVASAIFSGSSDPSTTKLQGIGLFVVGYLARPLGGVLFGRYADIKGRKPLLMISMLVSTLSLLAMASLPTRAGWEAITPTLFILLRLIQGMAFGLYVPIAWAFVAEHVPRQYMSVTCSYVTASFFVGVLFSNAFFIWLSGFMTTEQLIDYGWRLPFFIAAILSAVPLLAWRFISETPFFVAMKQSQPSNYVAKPFTLLFKHCKHSVFIGMILTLLMSSVTAVIIILLPDLIELRFTLDADLFGFSHSLGIVFMIFGCVFYGIISNYQNFGKILVIGFSLLIAAVLAFFYHLDAGGDYVLIMYALLGFFAGIIGMVPAIFVQLFPINVRLTGMAFCYNITYGVVGISVPFGLSYATTLVSFSPALYIAFIGFIGIIMGLYFYNLPEFKSIDHTI
ncbi:MFS transporter [Psychrobacter sp.]|uniref:MFS transporter n=1 Tax=Psychrobacter sp. TaxID=56811 RepID=UPI003F9B3E6B